MTEWWDHVQKVSISAAAAAAALVVVVVVVVMVVMKKWKMACRVCTKGFVDESIIT